ncbi:MAG: Asp-tRNA(Asn)/Glu-tRNA(Gln) amidotransferase subunit GatC [bacterium]
MTRIAMNKETINKLANLARIDISEKEAENLAGELRTILKYVSDLKVAMNKKQETITKKEDFSNRNVMRTDDGAHESGLYTEDLLNFAPDREGDYIRVKKILG